MQDPSVGWRDTASSNTLRRRSVPGPLTLWPRRTLRCAPLLLERRAVPPLVENDPVIPSTVGIDFIAAQYNISWMWPLLCHAGILVFSGLAQLSDSARTVGWR